MWAVRVRDGGADALMIDVRPSLGRDFFGGLLMGVPLGLLRLGSLTDGLSVGLLMELRTATKKVAGRLRSPTNQRAVGQRVDLEEVD